MAGSLVSPGVMTLRPKPGPKGWSESLLPNPPTPQPPTPPPATDPKGLGADPLTLWRAEELQARKKGHFPFLSSSTKWALGPSMRQAPREAGVQVGHCLPWGEGPELDRPH